MKLGAMILHLYKLLGEELPNRVNLRERIVPANVSLIQAHIEKTEKYTVELRHILESNGWFRPRGAHPAWENIGYNISNEVVLFLHNNPLLGEWELSVGLFSPWSKDFDPSMKFGYLKALGFDPKLEEIDFFWGRPICILQISQRFAQITHWYPQLMNKKAERVLTSVIKALPEGHLHVHIEDTRSGRNGLDAMNMIKRTEEEAWRKSDPVYIRNDQYGVHKIVTDAEVLYVLYCHGSDRFQSKAYSTPEEVAREAMRLDLGSTLKDWEDMARNTRIVHNLKRDNIHAAILLCSKLKLGHVLTVEEARVMQGFERFLEALVKHNIDCYEKLNEYMTRTVQSLKCAPVDEWGDATWCATRSCYGDEFRDKIRTMPAKKISTVRKRKCAGRYVSKLALLARIAGPNKLSAHEMVDRFRAYPKTQEESLADLYSKFGRPTTDTQGATYVEA